MGSCLLAPVSRGMRAQGCHIIWGGGDKPEFQLCIWNDLQLAFEWQMLSHTEDQTKRVCGPVRPVGYLFAASTRLPPTKSWQCPGTPLPAEGEAEQSTQGSQGEDSGAPCSPSSPQPLPTTASATAFSTTSEHPGCPSVWPALLPAGSCLHGAGCKLLQV